MGIFMLFIRPMIWSGGGAGGDINADISANGVERAEENEEATGRWSEEESNWRSGEKRRRSHNQRTDSSAGCQKERARDMASTVANQEKQEVGLDFLSSSRGLFFLSYQKALNRTPRLATKLRLVCKLSSSWFEILCMETVPAFTHFVILLPPSSFCLMD